MKLHRCDSFNFYSFHNQLRHIFFQLDGDECDVVCCLAQRNFKVCRRSGFGRLESIGARSNLFWNCWSRSGFPGLCSSATWYTFKQAERSSLPPSNPTQPRISHSTAPHPQRDVFMCMTWYLSCWVKHTYHASSRRANKSNDLQLK